MKLNKKNLQSILLVLFLCSLGGTLAWFIIERIFSSIGLPFSLSTGRLGFDLQIISFYFNVNPGTVLGIAAGFMVFKSI